MISEEVAIIENLIKRIEQKVLVIEADRKQELFGE